MKTRRDFVRLSAAAGLLAPAALRAAPKPASAGQASLPRGDATGAADREYWCGIARRLATPVLSALAERRLRATMPVMGHPSSHDRPQYSHLEAVGRLLAGLAPWLELGGDDTPEGRGRSRFAELARTGIAAGTDPASPDFLNFSRGRQPVVDAAFLAQALLRAPTELWRKLEPRVQQNVIAAMISSRPIEPGENNWKLFATTIEVFLHRVGAKRDDRRLFAGLQKHREWYVGDGMYGDGPEFHWDYYNSFVIQPMLLEALEVVAGEAAEWTTWQRKVRERFTRYAAIQERLIAPDGSYPAIGRSITYRCGAFHVLALAAWRRMLPKTVSPAMARVALTSVIRRTLEAPDTWDGNGWLQIGLAGHQPGLGEPYISTGSLYLCSLALLPLGLRADDGFWTAPAEKTTWERVWSGQDMPADHAIESPK